MGLPPGFNSPRESESCSVDSANGAPVKNGRIDIRKDEVSVLEGWSADAMRTDLPRGLWLVLEAPSMENYSIVANRGISRPDVAVGTHKPHMANAGYSVAFVARSLPKGGYSTRTYWEDAGGWVKCNVKKTLVVN